MNQLAYTPCVNVAQSTVWRAFKNGNTEALEQIYIEYFDLLCLYGRQFAENDPLLVEDCLQDLFIQLYTNNNKNNLSDTTSVKFYLMKSLRRLILHKRKNICTKNKELVDKYCEIENIESRIFKAEINKKQSEVLRDYIRHLPIRQRDAICLRFFGGLEFVDIAEKMNLNVKSVYKVIYKGLDKLRVMYDAKAIAQ